jgi:hypothetical protein
VANFEPPRAQSPQRLKKVFLRVLSVLCGKFGVQLIQPHYKGRPSKFLTEGNKQAYKLGKLFLGKSLVIAIAMALLLTGVANAVRPASISTPISGEVVSGVYVVSDTRCGVTTESF